MDQLVHQALMMIDTDSNDDENEKNDENDENRREGILSSNDQDERTMTEEEDDTNTDFKYRFINGSYDEQSQ